jgi:hypothetical protein
VTLQQLRRNAGVTAQPSAAIPFQPVRSRQGNRIADEEADGLRLLVVVGACGAFVAALRNSL